MPEFDLMCLFPHKFVTIFFLHLSSRSRQMKKKIKYFVGSIWRSPPRPVFIMFQSPLDRLLKSRMSGRLRDGEERGAWPLFLGVMAASFDQMENYII